MPSSRRIRNASPAPQPEQPQTQLEPKDVMSLFSLFIDQQGGKLEIRGIEGLKSTIFNMSAKWVNPDTIVLSVDKFIKVERHDKHKPT